jgi:hypothetical protein
MRERSAVQLDIINFRAYKTFKRHAVDVWGIDELWRFNGFHFILCAFFVFKSIRNSCCPSGGVTLRLDTNLGVTLERWNVPGASARHFRTQGWFFDNLEHEKERDKNKEQNQ